MCCKTIRMSMVVVTGVVEAPRDSFCAIPAISHFPIGKTLFLRAPEHEIN